MLPHISPMAIRVRHIRNLDRLNPVQLISVLAVAVIYVVLVTILTKRKPDWSSTKIKAISLIVIIPLLAIIVFVLE